MDIYHFIHLEIYYYLMNHKYQNNYHVDIHKKNFKNV